MKWIFSRHIQIVFWVSLVIKLIVSAILPLSSDEAYYWVWSQNLQLSYFDHPAFVSWIFWLGHPLHFLGHAVRWPAVLIGQGTLLIWILLLQDFLNEEKLKWWVYLALCSPLFGFGSIIVTPDLPLMFFWSLSLWFFYKIMHRQKIQDSIFLGAALGLGFCSKYHIVLFIPTALIYMTVENKWKQITWKYVGLIFCFGLIFSMPVIYWNYANGFRSFLFQYKHGLGAKSWYWWWTVSYVLGQVILIFPLVFWKAFRAGKNRENSIFFFFAWTPLAFFFLTSFKGLVEMNWPIAAYPAIFVLAVIAAGSNRFVKITCGFWLGLLMIATSNYFWPWIPNPPEKLNEPFRFQKLVPYVEKYQPTYASTYQMASYLWYNTKSPIYKLYDMSRYDFYDELPASKPSAEKFYLLKDEDVRIPDWVAKESYKVKEVEKINDIYSVLEISR